MFPLDIRAYGKINLYLEVGDIMENGLHSIKTVFHRADLYDDITVERTDAAGIKMVCDTDSSVAWGVKDIPTDERNLIYKAISRFHDSIGMPIESLEYGYFVKVIKRIPAAGGMGGGSADAGCVLAALNREFWYPLTDDKLTEIAASLGDDVPFFLFGQTAMLANGSGSSLGKCPSLPPCRMEFASCGEKASTAEMYRAHDRAAVVLSPADRMAVADKCDRLLVALERGDWGGIAENVYNSFEAVFTGLSESNAERFKEISDEFYGRGAAAVFLCGSGPTVCGIFPDLSDTSNGVSEIQKARELLKSDEKNTLAVVNRGESRVFTRRGVAPILELLNSEPHLLKGASVADKVTGAATAFMLVHGGAKRLHTGVISRRAQSILSEYGVEFTADMTVDNIINRNGDGFCPMETAVKEINDPAEAVAAVSRKLKELLG